MFSIPKAARLLLCAAWLTAFWAVPQLPAQGLSGLLSKSTSSTPAHAANDPLKRTTPHDAIYNFLEACHAENYALAAQYLDLSGISPSLRATEGPKLARQLGVLLDRNPNFEVGHLSNSPEGDTTDGFTQGLDNLASFDADGVPIVLQMHRVTQQNIQVWLVTPASVARIPELSSLTEESPIEKKLPAPLVRTRFIGTPVWVWIALVLLAIVLSALSELLSRGFIAVLKPLTKHYAKSFHVQRLEALKEPLRLLIVVVVFRACLVLFPTSALSRDYILKLLVLLFVLGAAALAMRLVDVISDQIISRLNPRERALSYSILPLTIRFIKIVIFCIGVLWVLGAWGYNTNAILAGIGVGGLAVALAAQKTIENLFGGVSLIIDRPVLVGDFCQFGGQLGTVEDIGLRSTRIRTLDRTLVTVPNSQFSTMTLENFSRRERMWFHPTLGLSRATTPEQVQQMMDAIEKILHEHRLVDASGVPVRFTKIGDQSLSLEIFAYVLTADGNEFLKVQTELLLKFLEAANELNVAFSVPITEALTIPYEANVLSRGYLSPAELPQDGAGQKAAVTVQQS
jgi:MscS family membrane protein